MTNQLSNEFIFSTSSPLALNDGINSLILGQVNGPASVNDGTASLWPTVSNNANCEINYNFQQVTQEQQQHQQQLTQQAVSFSADNLSQIQAQTMSQIVLLPTQNIQLLTNSIPNVGVLVPTNLVLVSNVEFDAVAQQQQQQQQQMILQQQQQQQLVQQEQECEYINLADTATQTVLSGLAETLNNGQTAQLISSNGQIVGIIGSDQLVNLPGGENQVLLAACIDPNDQNGLSQGNNFDINTMLASTISTMTVEKSDQDQAKKWLKDSYIVNRALKALKKTNGSSHHHHNRPLPQVIRRRE